MVESFLTPSHTNSLEPLLDKPLAGTLYHATSNGQSQRLELGIVDMVSCHPNAGMLSLMTDDRSNLSAANLRRASSLQAGWYR